MITHFNQESHFVYDIDTAKNYLSKVNNANSLKLNESEIEIILKTINKIKNKKEHEKGEKIIYIEKKLAVEVELFMREKIDSKDELTIFLSKQLNDENDRTKISLRKLAKKYEEEKGIKKSKSTIHNYLKKKRGYKYLKSTIKTNEILQDSNILISLAFIKIISRCIKFDLNIIYCDESYICSNNNNIKVWRKSYEEIFENIAKKEKINLILSVYEEGVLYYELNDTNTKSSTFIEYLKNLLKAIKEKNINHYAIVLDNYSAHKTD